MQKQDKSEFDIALSAALSINEKDPLEESVVDLWMSILAPYSLGQVKAAIRMHVSTSRLAPRPSDILQIIVKQDGRPESDEAWAIAVNAADEANTTIWTTEIEQAWFHCYPVFESGDKIGARMAFRQHYERLLQQSRSSNQKANWTLSLGHDLQLREQALNKAVEKKLISQAHADNLLTHHKPEGDGEHIAALVGYDKQPTQAASEKLKQNIKKLRDILAKPNTLSKRNQQRDRQRQIEQRKTELAEQVSNYQQTMEAQS